ncbi:hypothetical protein ACLB2K_011533 [Fragaria x ananassa]
MGRGQAAMCEVYFAWRKSRPCFLVDGVYRIFTKVSAIETMVKGTREVLDLVCSGRWGSFIATIQEYLKCNIKGLVRQCSWTDKLFFENLESSSVLKAADETKADLKVTPELKEETILREAKDENSTRQAITISADKVEDKCMKDDGSVLAAAVSSNKRTDITNEKENSNSIDSTPKPPMNYSKKGDLLSDFKNHQTAKKISSIVRNPSGLRGKGHLHSSPIKPYTMKREENVKNATGTSMLAQENQAIKRQKLDAGRSRQIYVREPAAPFVSMAEMMNRFQSSTRDLSLPHANGSLSHMKPKLTLTRPKEPEFETSQRVRSVRVKSTAELEEEVMAKIPKFKARPVNKKILKAPSLPAMSRSTPQPPAFQILKAPSLPAMSRSTPQPPAFQSRTSMIDCTEFQYIAC